ncbi:MAG TPA: CotH kinase family protein, partial [Myxococcota bacterium]|nr:CotH kinase family protein [Myxococcota bacterium]
MLLLLLACESSTRVYSSDPVAPLPGDRSSAELDSGLDYPAPEEATPEEEPPPAAPALVINELASDNRSLYQDESGNYSDYIEIYNPTSETVALNRLALRDGSGALWLGGAGELAPGAWWVVVADNSRSENHAPFALDRDEDTLTLLVDGQNVDQLGLGGLEQDQVWARYPDGGDWAVSIYPSAGASNGDDPGESRDPSDRLFRLDQIGRFDIGLSAAAMDALRVNRLSYVEGSAQWEGLSFPSVGIRLKAYVGSARTIDQKAGFKVDLNRYDSEGELLGVETLTLNNMVQDPSYIHERLAYMVFEAMGVPVPRVGYTRLYLNGTDMGLYLLVETVDENMIGRWFPNNEGNLYEGAYGVDLSPGYEFSFDCDECEDPNDRSDLTEVIELLQESPTDAAVAELEKKVDLDEILAVRATESVILHW